MSTAMIAMLSLNHLLFLVAVAALIGFMLVTEIIEERAQRSRSPEGGTAASLPKPGGGD